jgi:hypothetical protein
MELNEDNVRVCYQMARDFFAGGAKAYNKFYGPEGSEKKIAKAELRRQAAPALPVIRDIVENDLLLGDLMRETRNTHGNCHEAAALAASYVKEHIPGAQVWMVPIIGESIDHTFLLVGKNPQKDAVHELAQVPADEKVYAVDVWARVCCHISRYSDELQERMSKWESAGKRILIGKDGMSPVEWGRQVRELPLLPYEPDAAAKVEPEDKHAVLAALRDERLRQEEKLLHHRAWVDGIPDQLRLLESQPEQFVAHEQQQIGKELELLNRELRRSGLSDDDRTFMQTQRAELQMRKTLSEEDSAQYQGHRKKELLASQERERAVVAKKAQFLGALQDGSLPSQPSVQTTTQNTSLKRGRSVSPSSSGLTGPQVTAPAAQSAQRSNSEVASKRRRLW